MKDEEIIYSEGAPIEDQVNNSKEVPLIVPDEKSITDHYEPFATANGIHGEPEMTYVETTEDGEDLSSKDVTKKIREDLKVCRQEKEEYLTGWQRAKADYVNLQKELDLARTNISILTKEKMVEKLLPALDSFEMAFSNKEHWEKIDKDWQDGITSIYQQLLSGLEKSGIEKIDKIEVPFDPSIHQSISIVNTDDEKKDHTVEKVLQVGYKIGERVIRPAKVTIYEYKK
ncbi:nucleotide exchange factor GrpE [Candidatus Nomurabacteria bacterium RIFOXYC2_FULL_36_8]|nr:MAG: Protein GrpE [Candidatus Nomurabacteria bacterium GW2011_GWE2_36_115]KKP94168.1 MAG: Protein GrpE [Candidatus Nomurabacteria bacterium GW2011_GWF2_36_126]KKP96704.1 MAG: Protein GrpE [Candidatus Nomurabacteria bacterium GW2011_GWD2_36_14]KKP99692.1 MAG: Protein GrpE [Candidatus Nomurabacteria bacterium GW2011_GWF2_36_19]KKQ05363.1 MAG: Protein GrpE [Candidatus Nomurabacteria bacterium GW2011_GWF1_36_47]KKQ09042.1 MAG: Protein GrpE [Candidatus Nomurabacteria bacterium GW2011_GWB1_36_6]